MQKEIFFLLLSKEVRYAQQGSIYLVYIYIYNFVFYLFFYLFIFFYIYSFIILKYLLIFIQ